MKTQHTNPGRKSCLVVDDSSVIRRMAGAMFRDMGYAVSEAANGLCAVEHCRAQCPNIVLLDWNMPVMDGLSCLRTLRGEEIVPAARIMLCTTEASAAKIQTVLAAGADEYIIKPFDRDVLHDKLVLLGLEEPA
jgi:two-component system chemotaxis response regulator CheY